MTVLGPEESGDQHGRRAPDMRRRGTRVKRDGDGRRRAAARRKRTMTAPLTVDLGNADFWQDPHAAWREADGAARTARTVKGETILLDADDFDTVHTDTAFGQLGVAALERLGICDGPFHAWRARTMAAHDGAVHDRLRGSLSRSFNPRRVEPLRAALRAHAVDVLAQMAHERSSGHRLRLRQRSAAVAHLRIPRPPAVLACTRSTPSSPVPRRASRIRRRRRVGSGPKTGSSRSPVTSRSWWRSGSGLPVRTW